MKRLVIPFIFSLSLVSCKKENAQEYNNQKHIITNQDKLTPFFILGNWEIQSQSINNHSDLAAKCCRYIYFNPDNNPIDSIGSISYIENGDTIIGSFMVIDQNTIKTEFDFDIKTILFTVKNQVLSLNYLQNRNTISENWIKYD